MCISDPQGQAVAEIVVANMVGDVTTAFNDSVYQS
jgi:hypothetical protein